MEHSIVIVDDHILIAKAIAGIIESFPNYHVLYEVENGKALLNKLKITKNVPDIVLLDIAMPVMNGYETALWLREHHPGMLILALSMQDDDLSLIRMIKSGANGYLLKNVQPVDLHKALNELTSKGHYYPDWATGKLISSLHTSSGNNMTFTERENEFFSYVCTEMTYKEIGEKMFCSARTVEGYRDALFEKLGLKTRVGLAVYAIKNKKCSI